MAESKSAALPLGYAPNRRCLDRARYNGRGGEDQCGRDRSGLVARIGRQRHAGFARRLRRRAPSSGLQATGTPPRISLTLNPGYIGLFLVAAEILMTYRAPVADILFAL